VCAEKEKRIEDLKTTIELISGTVKKENMSPTGS
jgi:hypothetical protein